MNNSNVNSLGKTVATTISTTDNPTLFNKIIQSDYFSYIRKVGLAVLVFFVLYMLAKRIASIASKKFYEHATITDTNKQESM